MMDMIGSPAHDRNNSRVVDATSPSIRRNDDGSRTTANNRSTIAAPSEPNLFSPRSTAAMALSSISQIFSTETQTAAARHHQHQATTTGTRTMPPRNNAASSSLKLPKNERLAKTSDRKMADGSTMTHPQLPPPQSLFRSSTKAASTNKDSSSPSYNENDYDGGAPLPFIPNLPPTDHITNSRMVNGDAPPPLHHNHRLQNSNFGAADGSAGIPYPSHHDTEPHPQTQAQPYFYAATSHPAMMMMMKRQPSFPPSSMPDEPPSHSNYTSPQSHMTTMMTSNPHTSASDTTVPHSHVKLPVPRPYDLESQMLPSSSHPMMTMIMGQSHVPVQQQQPYPPTAATMLPNTAAMTPATGTKRDISSTTHVPNHWGTPYHPPLPAPNSGSRNHGTPSHNNHSNIAVTNHHHHHHPQQQQQQQEHHQHATPYHPIHRCSSYGSASSNQNTAHYDVAQLPQQQQQHQSQFLPPPPPPPQVVTSGPYHPRSVSWSNNEPLQWIPYSGPPQYMTIVPRQQQYYPTPSQVIPMYSYVTPTPHKKQKLGADSGSTPSKMLSASHRNVFCPPKAPLNKKKKSLTEEKISPSASQATLNPVHDDHTACYASTTSKESDLAAIVDEAQKKYNRKNKSLGILAESFLNHFTDKRDEEGHDLFQEIMIDRLSMNLNVERRRIYDVVNILEALQVIIKMGKNTYHWMGRQHLARQFALLQNEAIEAWPEYAAKSGFHPMQQSDNSIERKGSKDHDASTFIGASNVLDPNNEGSNKSLTRLSQLFLQVFLVGDEPLSLPQASDLIHGGRSSNAELLALGMKAGETYPTDEKKLQQIVARGLKTKIRRLYDIANVFLSVGLLQKCENRAALTSDGKRPQYFLNYHLSIHEIRSLYKTLPPQMIKSKSPFSEEQLSKLRKTSSIQTKVKYFGLSEPTESGANKDDPTKSAYSESPSEFSPPTNTIMLTQSLVIPRFEGHNATESSSVSPSTTMNLDSPSYVKEGATYSVHSSSSVGNCNMTASKSDVESQTNVSSSPATASQGLGKMNLPDDRNIQMDGEGCKADLHEGVTVGGEEDDPADDISNDNDPVRTAATVSPNNSSASMDVMMTTSSSPSSTSTTSMLSPRRVSLEK